MPISGWQWAALMNDGPYNWCTQHSAWGSWISRLEHTAKLICFVRDGRRVEGRLLSFRQERSTWCQERRRCSSCCLRCNRTSPPPHSPSPTSLSSPQTFEHMHQHIPARTNAHTHTLCWHSTYSTLVAQSSSVALTTDLSLMLNQCHFVTMPLFPLCKDFLKGGTIYAGLNTLMNCTGALLMSLLTLFKILVTTSKYVKGICPKAKS